MFILREQQVCGSCVMDDCVHWEHIHHAGQGHKDSVNILHPYSDASPGEGASWAPLGSILVKGISRTAVPQSVPSVVVPGMAPVHQAPRLDRDPGSLDNDTIGVRH